MLRWDYFSHRIVVLSHGRRIGRFDKGEVGLETLIDIVSDRVGETHLNHRFKCVMLGYSAQEGLDCHYVG